MKHIPRTILRGAIIVGVLCASIFTFVYAIDTPSFSVFNPTTSSIVAQWDAVPDASYYNVSTTASGEIIKTTDTHTAFTGLTPSTGYIFQIEAVDGSGTSSGFSAPTTTYTSPTIPSVSGFSNITTTSIQVNWGAITEAVYYTVSSTAGTVTTTNTTSTFTGLTPNTLHTFQVRAHDAYAQASAFSTAASTSTETLPQLAPPTISDFTNTTSSIQVFWDPITGASYYIISRSTSQTVTSNSSTVGVNTSADYILPWNRFYNYSASEMLYLKDEIATGAGPIDSVWFYKDSGNTTTTVNDVTVYLKHTSSTTLSSGVGSTAGYTQVYSGSFPNNVSSGWVGVSTTVFDYNGTDSLQMLIVKGSELFTPTRPYYRYTTTSAYRARYYYNDSSAFSSGVTSLTQTLNRPNTKFGLTITNLTGTIETVTTTDTNFIFSNLSPSTTYYFQVRTVDAISQSSVSSSVTSTFTETPPPPATPDISSFSNVTTTIGVTWGSVYGAIYYTVSSSAGTVTTTNTTYTFNNLPPNVQYTFQVKAHDAYNQSSSFSVASSTITVIPAPDTPEISSFVNTTTTIQVNWGAVSSTSYYTVSSTAGTVTTTQTNYTFTGLSPSTTYDFQMRATDEYSQNSDFSTVSSTITETPPVPDSPLFVTVTKTTSSIALAWNSVLYAEYYTVSSTAGTVTTTQSNYTYNDLTPNTAYTFQVNAVDMFERSSNFSGATTTVTDSLDPPATPAFNSIYKTYSSIELYWNIVSGALFYTVSSTAGTVTTTLNTYTFINLSPSTTYYFQIKATNLYDQESAYSTVTSTLTGRAPIFASSTAAISTSTTFTYTGAAQTYTVGSGVTSVVIEVWGAKGGLNGGLGGYATGRLSVTPGQPLYVYVGQKGVTSTSGYTGRTFNGGGSANHSSGGRGSGGGASDVRAGSTATTSRVIVGGGGGGGYTAAGGAGGGLVGATGGTWATPGTGGSQGAGGTGAYCSAHGSLGLGGSIESGCANTVDGGGGGYYGGGAGAAGGGGSSYIGGVTSATTTAGVWGGNGQIIIHASSTAGSGGSLSAITSSTNQSGYVTLVTSIDDADDDPLMITYRYSAGACGAYSSALATTTLIGTPSSTYGQGSIVLNNSTSTGYQLSNITTASGANTVTTTWDSRSQLPLAENSIYCIYSVVSDGAATSTVVTTTVTINNLGRSVASSLAVTAQTNGSGHVTVKTVFDDVNDDVLSLTYRYKSGSCTAYTGTEATSTLFGTPSSTYGQGSIVLNNSTSTGYQLSNITTASGANTVTTTWDSKTQLPAANGTYCVYVIAYDGTSTSTAVSTTVTLDNVSPSQPSISSFSDTATTITVNWGAISGASYYTVSSTAGATVTTTLTNRTFSSLTPTTTYTFQIMVTDSYNNTSTYSTASSTRTDQIYTPTISSFSSITTSSITVNWSAISGASYYTVSSTAGATVTTTLTSRTFTGLDTYALYSFQMTATDVNGLSSTSSIVTSTRTGLPEQLGATTIADLTAGTSTIQIGWDAIGGASYYIISRSTLVGLDTGGSQTTFSYTGASTTYTVPEGVTSILIDAYGAGGGAGAGSNAGSGARMKGIVSTTPGEVLKILVGESPAGSNGGGGGTFVVRSPYTTTSTVLVAAGGGGGNGTGVSAGRHGQITTSGGTAGGAGGTNGAGGTAGTFYGGGGFLTNGGGVGGGGSFITGAVGGGNGGSGEGGFGGGGQGSGVNATGGGGGGYSGGGGGSSNSGGGGGSIINGTTLIATAGGGSAPGAHGQVFITDQLGLSGSITSVTTTEISYLISGLSPSTTYYFQVNPVDQYGQVGVSSTVSSTYTQTPPPPVTPTIVSSTNNTSSIQISWDAIYGVSYYTVSSTAGATVTTTQTSRTFTGLTPSTTYNFQVKADDAYNQSSSFSNVLATSTILTSIASAPTLSAFTNITSNTIRVNWSTVLWNSYYTVSSTAGTITTTATNYTFSGLTPSTTHNFQVKSTDMWGRDTAYSSVGTTSTPKPSAPSTPTISSLDESTLNTSSTVRVYWDLISGASYYTLYYSTTVTTTSSGGGPSIVGTAYTTPSTYYVPFDRYYNYTATEILYLASEISTGAGTISSTAFYKNSGDTGTTITPVTIYMKHSTSTTLPTGVASTAGYTQVYSGAITNSMTSGWATTTLSPTFSYNGTSNLQILIVRGNQPYVLGSAIPVHAVSSTPTYLTRRFRDDTVSWVSGTTLLDQSYERPVIRFNLAQISTTTALSGTITSVTTTQTSTIITGLSPSTTYYFQIKAMDAYNQSSASSTVTSTITPPSPSPSSTIITSFSRTTSTITVNWAAASGAGYYTVSSTAGAAVTTTQTSRTFTGLNPNTSYSFQVQPANSYGVTTTYSSVSSTLTLALSPSVTSFAWPTTSSIQVTWSAVTGTTYYTVSSTAGTVTTTQTSYTYTGLTPGTTYIFQAASNLTDYSSASSTYILLGTFLSSIEDIGYAATFGTVNWNDTLPAGATVTMEVRAGNQSDLSDGVWTFVSKGSALNTNFDGRRYYQYRAILFTSSTDNVPSVEDVSISYYGPSTGSFISSPYDSGSALNFFAGISWTATVPSSTTFKIQVRTSPDNADWTAWVGPDGTNGTYFTDGTGAEAIPAALADGANDRWIQYRAFFEGNGIITPTLSDISLTYTVNATPDIVISTSTVTQASDGTVTVPYNVRDLDTSTGATPGVVSIDLQYCTASCWIPGSETWVTAASSSLSGDFGAGIEVDASSSTTYTSYSLIWTPALSYNNQYNDTNFKIRLRANDGEAANNTGVDESNTFTLDTTDPVVTNFITDARTDAQDSLTITVTDDTMSGLEMKLSSVPDLGNDGTNAHSGEWIPYTATSSWTFLGSPAKVYYQIRDAYGNISSNGDIILIQTLYAPPHFVYQDVSNAESGDWREFLAWEVIPVPTNGFNNYTLYRSTDGETYSVLTTETDRTVNYYLDQSLDTNTTYYYKITVEDDEGNISNYSSIVMDTPDGQGGSDTTAPTISNVATPSIGTQSVTITWDTDELSNSYIDYIEVPGGDFSEAPSVGTISLADTEAGIGEHQVILTGLTPNTTYYYQVRSIDPSNNVGTSTPSPDGHSVTTLPGPSITGIGVSDISNTQVTVAWTTDEASDSYVYYSIDNTFTSSTVVGNADAVNDHSVTLPNLTAGTTYYYYVKSGVAEDKNVIDGEIMYHTFTTLNDQAPPVITFDEDTDVEVSDAAMIVSWTTNEPATTVLEYGTSTSYGTVISNNDLNTSHDFTISGLTIDTLYYVRFTSTDLNDNASNPIEFSTTTSDSTDYTPPVITSVTTTVVTDDQALITWTTNEGSTSQVYYGTSSTTLPDLYSTTNSNYDRTHAVVLSSLTISTEYYYYVMSVDLSGNITTSTPLQSFTTLETLSEESEVLLREQAAAAAAGTGSSGGGSSGSTRDATAPTIFNAQVGEVGGTSAKITWSTDEGADSVVEFGTTLSYGKAGVSLERTIVHEIVVSDLLPLTLYSYRISSADASGNRSEFTTGSFTTTLTDAPIQTTTSTEDGSVEPDVAEEMFLMSMQRATELIKSLSTQVSVEVLETSLLDQASIIQQLSDLLPRPVIGGQPVVDESANNAAISWTTDKESNSLIEFAPESVFAETGVYNQTIGDSIKFTNDHSVEIQGLQPATTYRYRVISRTPTGAESKSKDFSFTTKAQSIEIGSYKISVVSPEEAVFGWSTSLPTDSSISYAPYRNGVPSIEARQVVRDPSILTEHSMTLKGLEGGVTYDIELSGKDSAGNTVSKLIQGFLTDDTDASPVISQIKTDSSIIPGAKDRIQVIISWTTNELATSQVFYRSGFGSEGAEFEQNTILDLNYTKKHIVVVTNFEPGSVYQFVVESKDSSGNLGRSKTLTVLTPQKEESVFQVIMGNFEDLFGWVGKLRK